MQPIRTTIPIKPIEPHPIRVAREAKLWTQRKLAGRAKVSLRTIHSIEQGLRSHLDTKRKILEALGLPLERWVEMFPERSKV